MKKLAAMIVLVFVAAGVFAGTDTTSGTIYNQQGEWAKAVVALKRALASDPKDAKAQFQIGISYSNLDSVALAYQHFIKAKELDPKKARDVANNIQSNYARHYKSGQDAFKQTDVMRAANEFYLATQADPTQSAGYYNLSVMYSRLAMTDSTYNAKSLTAADEVLKLSAPSDPNYTNACQLAMRALVQMGRPDEAVARAQAMIDKDPTKFAAVEQVGNELFDAKNWKGAETMLQVAADARAKTGADDFDVYNKIGVARFNMRKQDPAMIDLAIESYTKALDLRPDDSATVFNLMVAHMSKENWGEAATFGEKYVSMMPSDPSGWQALAQCYTKLGDNDKAMEALQRYNTLKG